MALSVSRKRKCFVGGELGESLGLASGLDLSESPNKGHGEWRTSAP
jgi:hypothetical protein